MTSDNIDIVEYLRRNAVFNHRDTYIAAANEIERLRAERDEARRDLCHADEGWPFSDQVARMKAIERGWDCFKETQ